MTRFVTALLVSLAFARLGAAAGPQVFTITYQTGHAGFEKKFVGTLWTDDRAVHVDKGDRKPKPAFEIPLNTVVAVKATTERENKAFGTFSSNEVRNQEYVTITVESAAGAEAIRLKVGRHQSDNIAAKIDYARRQVRAQVAP